MKYIPILLILAILLTGCINLQTVEEDYHIIEPQTYYLDDIFHGLLFHLPGNNTYGATASISIFKPNGESYGTYRETVLPEIESFEVSTHDTVILYYPGMWHIDYQINTNETILGGYNFWVINTTYNGLERFEIESSSFENNIMSLSVRNNGRETGYVNIIIFNDNPAIVGGNTFYGKEYVNERVSLRPGYRKTFSVTIMDVNPALLVMLNQDVYEV